MKTQLAMPIAIVVILIAVIVPLPTIMLDVLISANISLSVVILLAAVYLLKPVQFSSFPSILLLTTLFRLSLNIASTRLILLNGSQGMSAAGDVIRAFGQFVVGGNYAVGIVIFLVLIVIQYVVINHLRKLVERFLPHLAVISPNGIPPNVQIVSLGVAGQ